MQEFSLAILATDCDFYEGPCESLIVPTADGKRGILANHSNLIEAIVPGELKFTVPGEEPRYAVVSEGMLKVEDNEVLVLVDFAERPEDVEENKKKREEARKKEQELQKKSHREYVETEANLRRAMMKLGDKKDYEAKI